MYGNNIMLVIKIYIYGVGYVKVIYLRLNISACILVPPLHLDMCLCKLGHLTDFIVISSSHTGKDFQTDPGWN